MNPIFRYIFPVLLAPALYAQAVAPAPVQQFQYFDNNGKPLAGGKVCSYAAGTTTPLATYGNSAATPNANPVILDSAGRAGIWLGPVAYKIVLRAAGTTNDCTTGTIIYSVDGVFDPGQKLRADLAAITGASLIGYRRTGGAATTVQAVLDNAVSVLDFGAVADGTDQHAVFQATADYLNGRGGGVMEIPAAPLCFGFNQGTQIYANITVQLDAGACVKRVNSQSGGGCTNVGCRAAFYTSLASNPSNVHIVGQGTIDGNRANNAGIGAGGAADGVFVNGWKDSSIEGITIKDSPADGITMFCSGPSASAYSAANTLCGNSILIDKVLVSNATRNGITAVGTHVTISNSHITGTNGSAPQNGIDIEPDWAGDYFTGLTLINNELDHNTGSGTQIAFTVQSDAQAAVNVINNYFHDNTVYGLVIANPNNAITGSGIQILGGTYLNNPIGIVLDNEHPASGGTAVLSNIIISANVSGGTGGINCTGASNVILAGGYVSGSSYDYSGNTPFGTNFGCVPYFAGMKLAHDNYSAATYWNDAMQYLEHGQQSPNLSSGCVPVWVSLGVAGSWQCSPATISNSGPLNVAGNLASTTGHTFAYKGTWTHQYSIGTGGVQLPTCSTTLPAAGGTWGLSVNVFDSLAAPVYNAVAVGGGIVNAYVYCDGASWRYH